MLGALRVASGLALASVGSLLVLLAALVPGRVRGSRVAPWVNVALARTFLVLFAVRIDGPPAAALRSHPGLVFINHLTYLDAVVMFARGPVRFLATSGVRSIPFIGQIAMAVDTVFVNRADRESRAASRARIREALRARPSPPVTLAPEGQIGPGDGVLPFRRGAFEIAVETGLPILPVVLSYAPFDAVIWHQKELLLLALWRLGARRGGVRASITPLPIIRAQPAESDAEVEAEAARLAAYAEEMYRERLGGRA